MSRRSRRGNIVIWFLLILSLAVGVLPAVADTAAALLAQRRLADAMTNEAIAIVPKAGVPASDGQLQWIYETAVQDLIRPSPFRLTAFEVLTVNGTSEVIARGQMLIALPWPVNASVVWVTAGTGTF